MDKRSFNLLFTVVAASMVILGTYKVTKKRTHLGISHHAVAPGKTHK